MPGYVWLAHRARNMHDKPSKPPPRAGERHRRYRSRGGSHVSAIIVMSEGHVLVDNWLPARVPAELGTSPGPGFPGSGYVE